jgi:hypothetical protein
VQQRASLVSSGLSEDVNDPSPIAGRWKSMHTLKVNQGVFSVRQTLVGGSSGEYSLRIYS